VDPAPPTNRTDSRTANREDIREFLATRRARLTPAEVGLPAGSRRRVPGLRREEVLAGVSTEWYTRLEKGHITDVSEDVLDAVAAALRLNEAEHTYLFDLARAARPAKRTARRRKPVEVPDRIQWMLDSMHGSAAIVVNGRLDILATNDLGRALYSPLYAGEPGPPNIARYQFLDPTAHDYYPDWDGAANVTAALLRTEAGRDPYNKELRDLIGELSTLSEEFRSRWGDAQRAPPLRRGQAVRPSRRRMRRPRLPHHGHLDAARPHTRHDRLHRRARHRLRGPAQAPRLLGRHPGSRLTALRSSNTTDADELAKCVVHALSHGESASIRTRRRTSRGGRPQPAAPASATL